MENRVKALACAAIFTILPLQAHAAQLLITGSGSIGSYPLAGQNIGGPNGALYASLAGMGSHDTYSFSVVIDGAQPKFNNTQYYNTSDFKFSINGSTILSKQLGGFATVHVTDDLADFFVLSITSSNAKLFPSLPSTENSSFTIQYGLPPSVFNSTTLSPDPAFLSGYMPQFSMFYISSNGSGVEDMFSVNSLSIRSIPVPEPTTWLMMISGVGLIGAKLRFSRRAVALRGNPATD